MMAFGMAGKTLLACSLAWLVPGGGHLFLKRWKRGLTFLAVILALFFFGLSMDGHLFGFSPGFFGLLKLIAGLALGLPYIAGQILSLGEGHIKSLGYEYGNTYLYTAGLLNMLLVVDVFDIAQGRKS